MAETALAIHGGRVHEAARELGLPPEAILDFSANLNPLGPPSGVIEALRWALPSALLAYPDADPADLKARLCARHGACEEHLILGSGGASLLFLALRALAPKQVALPLPAFSEQARAVAATGILLLPLDAGLPMDLARVSAQLNGADALILTNPHNPTGQLWDAATLGGWLEAHPHLALVLDEAFMDYTPWATQLPDLLARPRTVILRSLTKFYAMPGLRVGHAFADAATAARMRDLQEGWPVGQLALLAAEAALRDKAFEIRSLASFRAIQPVWRAQLEALPGAVVLPSAAPFFLLRLLGPWGTRLAAELRREGILIRTCEAWPGLDDHHLRLAVKDEAAHARLLPRLRALLEAWI